VWKTSGMVERRSRCGGEGYEQVGMVSGRVSGGQVLSRERRSEEGNGGIGSEGVIGFWRGG
jgi:hypothetical protein